MKDVRKFLQDQSFCQNNPNFKDQAEIDKFKTFIGQIESGLRTGDAPKISEQQQSHLAELIAHHRSKDSMNIVTAAAVARTINKWYGQDVPSE